MNTKNNIPVFRFDIAKYLLSKGYHIVDIAPNLNTGNKYETVFFFKDENNIMLEIKKFAHR